MPILRDLSIMWALFHVIVMFVFLYESRYTARKTIVLTLIFMLPLMVFNAIACMRLGTVRYANLVLLLCTLPSLIFFYILAKNRDGRFFFTFCLVDTVSYEIIVITTLLEYYIGKNQFILMFILRLLAFPILEFVMWKYLRKIYLDAQNFVVQGWGLFTIPAALFYVILVVMSSYPTIIYERPHDVLPIVLVMILMPAMYLIIFRVLLNHQKLIEEREKKRNIELQTQLLQNELMVDQKYLRQAKRTQHDYRHHNRMIQQYAQRGDTKAVIDYIDALEKSAFPLEVRYCDNICVDNILRFYIQNAKAEDINFQYDVEMDSNTNIQDIDLVAILANVLENAIHGCENVKNDKKIHITVQKKGIKVLIKCVNTAAGYIHFENGIPKRKKGDGVGVQSIIQSVDKYRGDVEFTYEKDLFTCRIILNDIE